MCKKNPEFGKQLYSRYEMFRKAKGYNNYDVAKITGIASASFTDWKNGTIPTVDKLYRIGKAVNCTVDDLLAGVVWEFA